MTKLNRMDSELDTIQPSLNEFIDLHDYYPIYNDQKMEKGVDQWGGEEVSEWAREVISQNSDLDPFCSELWHLRSLSGRQLLNLTQGTLINLVGSDYAGVLQPRLNLLQQNEGTQNNQPTLNHLYHLDTYDTHFNTFEWEDQAVGGGGASADAALSFRTQIDSSFEDLTANFDDIRGNYDEFKPKMEHSFEDLTDISDNTLQLPPEEYGAFGGGSPRINDLNNGLQVLNLEVFGPIPNEPFEENFDDEDNFDEGQKGVWKNNGDDNGIWKSRGDDNGIWKSRGDDSEVNEEELLNYIWNSNLLERIPSETRKRARGPRSWEFLMRLLADPITNPSVVRWEDESKSTFRLIRPSLIAHVWSSRPGLPRKTSYNNFARGLRHHYTTGALYPVMEKQLVYRCGNPAIQYYSKIKQQKA